MFLEQLGLKHPSVKRHAMKTITWRIVGTIDSVVLAWIVTGDPMIGLKIGGLELFTKMILYFIHERVWYKINFGLPHRKGDETIGQ
jgi:uncharacterized membrane protein